MRKTRREFLGAAGTLAAAGLLGAQDGTKSLSPTESNIEGPFYRKDAPFRSTLAEGVQGEALVISGRVLAADGKPLRDAVVDVWHASAEGAYDNESAKFLLRGRIRTDKDGLYRYETIMPGQYDLGEAKRPAHIHYKVSVDAHRPLTTQLYFKGDKWLERDPFVRKSLIIGLEKSAGTFDIVLAKA
jgi:catechol 1,2-dioxygenase